MKVKDCPIHVDKREEPRLVATSQLILHRKSLISHPRMSPPDISWESRRTKSHHGIRDFRLLIISSPHAIVSCIKITLGFCYSTSLLRANFLEGNPNPLQFKDKKS